ncbi:uncharacterized protein I206_106863 [Kwoniella pini CBS 10737]|uniref:UDP-N-acetylglucosamine diphosphorylase n=1 Tax=Kwoniella pini CBS 10737 TaxID=1296096 RepID=A0A1B9HZW8_9TREE|nr:UDP-N-acetylglucosamine pyrophosphorylase [Kwoniella pini CBS 10737]OCF48810.1 UDP-N-acetylglucosamine pyrophosphorylase [Kwoniella pini CBS 10737]
MSSLPIQINGANGNNSPSKKDSLLERVKATYEEAGQSHVFTFFDKLSTSEQNNLLKQLDEIDIHRVNRIYKNAILADGSQTLPNDHEEISPLPEEACATIINNPIEESKWRKLGLEAISKNQVAVLLLAGGQGTRLGSSLPKGMYDINLPSKKSLFEYQGERIGKLAKIASEKAGKKEGEVRIKWYVMTSGPTRGETEKYFKEKDFFGLNKDDVIFFEQGVLPALSEDGKLLLSTPSSLSVAPDGNGGLYAALRRPLSSNDSRTVLSDMKSNGIEYIHAYCVDNCLVKVADPVFIGYCLSKQSQAGAKVVKKTIPNESVGILALKGKTFTVIEYSELSKEKSELKKPNNENGGEGELLFKAANIANHFYNRNFLEKIELIENKMSYHIARKKIQTINLKTGEIFKPNEINGMKLELFIFDVFPFINDLAVFEVSRQEEFSPLKNSPGSKADCPETSRKDLLAQQKRWLLFNGAIFDNENIEIEVTPNVSYSGEGLDWVKGKKFIKSGVLSKKEDLEGLIE